VESKFNSFLLVLLFPPKIAATKLKVSSDRLIIITSNKYMLRRLMLHIVEEPVLWRKTEEVRVNQCEPHSKCRQRRCCGLKKHAADKGVCHKKHEFYHSSVSQAQGSSYFITNDGNVPTSPYKIPANTHTLSW
jgi:hypothetical protein